MPRQLLQSINSTQTAATSGSEGGIGVNGGGILPLKGRRARTHGCLFSLKRAEILPAQVVMRQQDLAEVDGVLARRESAAPVRVARCRHRSYASPGGRVRRRRAALRWSRAAVRSGVRLIMMGAIAPAFPHSAAPRAHQEAQRHRRQKEFLQYHGASPSHLKNGAQPALTGFGWACDSDL